MPIFILSMVLNIDKMLSVFLVFFIFSSSDSTGLPGTLSNPCTDDNHLFLAPGVLTAGGTNRACVSRFYPDGPAHMVLTLRAQDNKVVTASRELLPGDGGCLDIAVPQKPNTKADLSINLRYPEAQCSWEGHLTVRISGGKLVVVHTDRARYRPGETLRVRVFALKTNLAPAQGNIDEIWLEGPRGAWDGSRATQWLRVPTRMGIAQVQYEIDEQAPTGRWTVRAKLSDGSQGSAGFIVGNYELPPFQMSVRHAARVLNTSERLVWTVCVRYPWTEAVEGMLVIRIRGAGGTGGGGGGIRTAVRLRAPRACHRHAAAAKRIGLNDTNPPDVVIADFSFQEEGTGIWQNTTVISQVVDKAVTLEFLTKHRSVISPGLPYKLKIKATRWDEKPASNERIRVCRSPVNFASPLTQTSPSNVTPTCNDAVTDDKGVARVMFTSAEDGGAYYKFQATLVNDTTIAAPPLQLPAHRGSKVHAALGPLRADKQADRTFVPLYMTLKNATKPITVHFVVITRGGIIYRWGATTQCAITNSGDHFHIATRDGYCYNANLGLDTNLIQSDENITHFDVNMYRLDANMGRLDANMGRLDAKMGRLDANIDRLDTNTDKPDANITHYDASVSDALLDRQMLRVMLPIKVTHQMCPDSHLIAYFYYNGELVSASKHFEMDECFANKVETTWLSRQAAPGSLVRLHIHADSRALCALSALDTAARTPSLPPSTSANALLIALRRLLDSHRNLTEYDAAGQCFLTSDTPELPTDSQELMATWLAAAGVRLAGGNPRPIRRCDPAPAPLIDDEATVPRSDFSEAWLWRLVEVGTNGTLITNARAPDSISKFEANTICLTKTGVAVSSPATLQVFREFFIHADGPRRLRRGDSAIIRYRLFNYLYEPLSVQVQIVTDPHLEGPVNYVETACVGARAAEARRVTVRARLAARNARLSVRAKAVRDGNCANATNGRTGVSDEVIIQITVDPEGVPIQEHKSALLCAEGSVESGKSQVSWNWPPVDAVQGTESLTVWAVADLAGPLYADADALVLLPRGCGEQNMARLATNLLALRQLSPLSADAAAAREHVARGFTRQLQYVHPMGGFSAFGKSDPVPSAWLTAFSLKYLRKAHQVLSPGLPAPPALDQAERWLLRQQMENGCFRNEGQVFHRELRGGLNEEGEIASVALTAYVITALVESSSTLSYRVVRNTLSCLRALPSKVKTPTRVYALALLSYTFMRLRRYEDELRKTNEASLWDRRIAVEGLEQNEEMDELMILLHAAKRSGDYVWWETSSLSTSIEATGYALLALAQCASARREAQCAPHARATVRWLSAHRNSAGGFVATQDTLVALEALTAWSSVQPSSPTNLSVTAYSGGSMRVAKLKSGVKVPDILKLETSEQLNIAVKGSGCALVQATRSYNSMTPSTPSDKRLSVQVSVHTEGPFGCDANNTDCFCAAVVEACVVWTGTFPEMALLEVFLPGGYGADAAMLYAQLHRSNTMLRRIELSPSGGRATLYLSGAGAAAGGAHRCFSVPAVGGRTRTRPAHVALIDYYAPHYNHTQMYTIPEECPPKISRDTNEYHASDNLFNKARSLSDSEEIVIMHEYSFEDIPDGIPLEDPIFENLTQNSKKTQINELQSLNNMQEFDHSQLNNHEIVETNDPSRMSYTAQSKQEKYRTGLDKMKLNNVTRQINYIPAITYEATKSEQENRPKIHDLQPNSNLITQRNYPYINESEYKQDKRPEVEGLHLNRHGITQQFETIDTTTKAEYKQNKEKYLPITNVNKDIETERTTFNNDNLRKPNNEDVIEHNYKIEASDDVNENTTPTNKVENPNLSSFHVIESEKDLDVPTGIEGPIPAIVLPPQNFMAMALPPALPPGFQPPRIPPEVNRGFQFYPTNDMYSYYYRPQNAYKKQRRYKSPFG